MKFLIINSIEHNYSLYFEENVSSFYITQSELPIDFKDNIVYLLDYFLKLHNLNLDNLDFIGAVTGPGSYTSIRVGLSMANTLGLALQIPVIGTNLFDVLLLNFKRNAKKIQEGAVLITIYDNIGGYFGQIYDKNFNKISDTIELDNHNIYDYITRYQILTVVSNKSEIKDILVNLDENIRIYHINGTLVGINSSILYKYNAKEYNKDASPLEAFYIKPPKITLPKVRIN